MLRVVAAAIALPLTMGAALAQRGGIAPTNATRTIDYEQCREPSDFGWPRFEREAALYASPWKDYFAEQFGGLPKEYPFCTYDLWTINKAAKSYPALGLILDPAKESKGNTMNHTWHAGDYNDGDFYKTDFGAWIYHSDAAVVKNHTWIEVEHLLFKTETKAMWFTRARGTGIWYNVGKTITFVSDDNHPHTAAYKYFGDRGCNCTNPNPPPGPEPNCSDPKQIQMCLERGAYQENAMAACAAAEGYESVQFAPAPGPIVETFGHVGWLELLSTSLVGKYACGTPEGGITAGFRSGWRASEPCDCVEGGNEYDPTNCNGNKK